MSGLHGSDTATNMPRAAAAEFVGTFFLVLIGTGVAVAAILDLSIAGAPADSFMVAMTFGLTLLVLVYVLGHVSGCHLNPAVTLGLMVTGKFPKGYGIVYMLSQLLGAICASLALWMTYGNNARYQANLGATQPADGVSDLRVFAFELVVTFFLVLVIMSVATDERAHPAISGLAIGFALFVAVAFAGPFTGGAVNPARALGPMIVSQQFSALWAYIVGPLLGGVMAAIFYNWVLAKAVEPSEAAS